MSQRCRNDFISRRTSNGAPSKTSELSTGNYFQKGSRRERLQINIFNRSRNETELAGGQCDFILLLFDQKFPFENSKNLHHLFICWKKQFTRLNFAKSHC